MTLREQYEICQLRGHEANPYAGATMNAIANALAWYKCQHCGTEFATKVTTDQLERNIPSDVTEGSAS